MSDLQPSPRAREYLAQAALCFLACLDGPTVVMCRSVLDVVFEEAVADPVVREHVPERIRGSIGWANRIDAAEKSGWLARELAALARKVKNAGNDVVHNVPLTTFTPLEAIAGTIRIVELVTRRAA